MPSRNIAYRTDVDDAYYHVYGRGHARMPIFLDEEDNAVLLSLLKRYLGKSEHHDKRGRLAPNYHDKLELMAFCLMGNHFHLLIHQIQQGSLTKFMQGLVGSYGRYFNRKYKRTGSLLESRYKASIVLDDDYLLHVSRYIHLNPDDYENYKWSSLGYYLGKLHADWIKPSFIIDIYRRHSGVYEDFIDEYKSRRDEINEEKSRYFEEYDEPPSADHYSSPELSQNPK
jgi:REP element-mobilizing transposase RayT